MSEPALAPQAPAAPAAPAETAQPQLTEPPEQTEIDWKAKAREWERRAKDNFAQIADLKPKAEQFQKLEDASKSEAQRLTEAAEASKRDAESARAEAIRYKAAATHGISAEHFDLLGSGTEEEISARAEKIATLLAAKAAEQAPPTGAPIPTRPVEQMRPGATPGDADSAEDVLYKQLFG